MFAFDPGSTSVADGNDDAEESREPIDMIEPVDVADDLMLAMGRLSELLEMENAALAAFRSDVSRDVHEEKLALSRLYVQRLKALAGDAQRLEAARQERGEELREAAERLKRLGDANATLVRSQMDATRKFLDGVIEAARDHEGKPRYGRNGAITNGRTASLSFNETL